MAATARLLLALAALAAAHPGGAAEPPRTLRWSAVPGAVRYELEIAVDPAFRSVVSRASTARTSFPWTAAAPRALRYRVRALRRDGSAGPWSAPRLVAGGLAPDDRPASRDRVAARPGALGSAPVPPAPGPAAALATAFAPAPAPAVAQVPAAAALAPAQSPGAEGPRANALAARPPGAARPEGRAPPARGRAQRAEVARPRRAPGSALEVGAGLGWRSRLEGDGSPAAVVHGAAWPLAAGRAGIRLQADGFMLALGPTPVHGLEVEARFAGVALQAGPAVRERAGPLRLEAGLLAGAQLGRAAVAGVVDRGASFTVGAYGGAGVALGRAELALELHVAAGDWRSAHAVVPLGAVSALAGLRWGLR